MQQQQNGTHQNGNGKHIENGKALTNGNGKIHHNKPQRYKQQRNKLKTQKRQNIYSPPSPSHSHTVSPSHSPSPEPITLPLYIKHVSCGSDFTVCADSENVIWTWGNPNWISRDTGYLTHMNSSFCTHQLLPERKAEHTKFQERSLYIFHHLLCK